MGLVPVGGDVHEFYAANVLMMNQEMVLHIICLPCLIFPFRFEIDMAL